MNIFMERQLVELCGELRKFLAESSFRGLMVSMDGQYSSFTTLFCEVGILLHCKLTRVTRGRAFVIGGEMRRYQCAGIAFVMYENAMHNHILLVVLAVSRMVGESTCVLVLCDATGPNIFISDFDSLD